MQIITPAKAAGRVGFVVPRWTTDPVHDCQGTTFRCFPVAGALVNAGYELVYFDQEHDLDRNDRREAFRDALQGVEVVFFWMNELWPYEQTVNTLGITSQIKTWYPDVKVAVGGSFITVCTPEMLYGDGPVDFFIRGYGEQACPELLEALQGRSDFEEVSGLVWKQGADFRHNPIQRRQRLSAENNALPYRQLDMTPYIQRKGGIFGNHVGTLILGTGQGCAKGCNFCYWRNHEVSLIKAEELVELAAFLHETYGVTQYHLADLDFFTSRGRPRDFARLWSERLPACGWYALVSPVDCMKLSPEDWELLARGGCAKLELGTESGSPDMLERLGKTHDAEDPFRITRTAVEHGIAVMHNFIFGFVGETPRARKESIRLILRLYRLDTTLVSFAFRLYQPTPMTPMGDEAIALMGSFPKTVEELLAQRPLYAESSVATMPWLAKTEESSIKKIVSFYLPLATSKLVCTGPLQGALYRMIRWTARLRLRTHFFAAPFEQKLYDRYLGQMLALTYRP